MQGRRVLRRLLTWPLVLLAALVIAFEEFAWDELADGLRRLGHVLRLRRLEPAIRRLSPHQALALYTIPVLGLLPVKLTAVWLIGQGHALLGLAIILLAKLLGTSVVAWLFGLTRDALLQVPWFSTLYQWFLQFRQRIYYRLALTRAWITFRALLQTWRTRRRQAWSRLAKKLAERWQHLRK
ncbi:MAG TPA: hypothetical protein VJ642_11130 [Chromobacteriaceae bacterium]|nr:hypothetical protein [Chromobacteriaceae bacterium]